MTTTPIALSTHVLDTARGKPAEGVPVTLEQRIDDGQWVYVNDARTDADGRVADLVPEGDELEGGVYRVRFDLLGAPATAESWYPEITIVVRLAANGGHSHVPLLLAPYGYSTYRGS
jgi:5-hydroxyisourate hydrolase